MIALCAGIVATSVVGSIHCVAMCGPLVGLHGGTRSMRLATTHSAGRLGTYVLLGTLAGAFGGALDLAGRLGNIQRAATIVSAIALLGYGLVLLARARGIALRPARPARGNAVADALVSLRTRKPMLRAWLGGVLTGMLPCGWLWAFVITAGGTASAWRGAVVMLAFWLGTVPAMVGLLGAAGPALGRLRARMPAITAAVVILLGLGTLALRWRDAGTTQITAPHCHCHDSAGSSGRTS